MKKNKPSYLKLVETLLEKVPEIQLAYSRMERFNLSEKDISEIVKIREVNHLPDEDVNKPGATIVFETLLVPFLISLIHEESNSKQRLMEIMRWIEYLANHDDFRIRNLVASSVCAPLLTTYEYELPEIFRYIGLETKNMFKQQLDVYLVEDSTRALFRNTS